MKEQGDPSASTILGAPAMVPAERVDDGVSRVRRAAAARCSAARAPQHRWTSKLSMFVRKLSPQEDKLNLRRLRGADLPEPRDVPRRTARLGARASGDEGRRSAGPPRISRPSARTRSRSQASTRRSTWTLCERMRPAPAEDVTVSAATVARLAWRAMDYVHLGRTGLKVSRLCLGTMNFGPQTDRGRLVSHHGPRARARDQLLRHRQRLRLEEGRGLDRADRRPLARPGRRPAREDRPRDEGLRDDGRLAEPVAPLRAAHRPRVRGLAEAAADRRDRPLPDAPRRPREPVGRDLAGDGDARPPGQGDLRRLVELRGLAHRAGLRGRAAPPLPRPRVGAEPLQPHRSHRSSSR